MKKAIIALLIVILVVILGVGGFFIWKLNDKLDKQSDKISTINDKLNDQEKNDKSTTNTSNSTNNSNSTTNTSNSNKDTNNSSVANSTNTSTSTTTNSATSNTTNSSVEEANVKSAFEKLLAQNQSYSKYRVDSVKVLTDSEKQAIVSDNSNYESTDVLAYVTFSVVRANAQDSEEWSTSENYCICYRNGSIVGFGTKWRK